MFTRLLVLVMIAGCASNRPTPYQKEKEKTGYQDSRFEELTVATFRGNSYTKKPKAQLYAEFRAIDSCRSRENKNANIIDIFDKTIEKEITRSSGSGWSPTYFGMYPYYSRYSSFGIGAGYSTMSTDYWNETVRYPVVEVYYTCTETVYRPQVIFKELPKDEIKHLVKDVKGAIQVEKILGTSPNKTNLENGDIILKANGKRIEKVYQLIRLFNKDTRDVAIEFLREGDRKEITLRSVDITSEVNKMETDIINKVCKDRKDTKQDELRNHNLCQTTLKE